MTSFFFVFFNNFLNVSARYSSVLCYGSNSRLGPSAGGWRSFSSVVVRFSHLDGLRLDISSSVCFAEDAQHSTFSSLFIPCEDLVG